MARSFRHSNQQLDADLQLALQLAEADLRGDDGSQHVPQKRTRTETKLPRASAGSASAASAARAGYPSKRVAGNSFGSSGSFGSFGLADANEGDPTRLFVSNPAVGHNVSFSSEPACEVYASLRRIQTWLACYGVVADLFFADPTLQQPLEVDDAFYPGNVYAVATQRPILEAPPGFVPFHGRPDVMVRECGGSGHCMFFSLARGMMDWVRDVLRLSSSNALYPTPMARETLGRLVNRFAREAKFQFPAAAAASGASGPSLSQAWEAVTAHPGFKYFFMYVLREWAAASLVHSLTLSEQLDYYRWSAAKHVGGLHQPSDRDVPPDGKRYSTVVVDQNDDFPEVMTIVVQANGKDYNRAADAVFMIRTTPRFIPQPTSAAAAAAQNAYYTGAWGECAPWGRAFAHIYRGATDARDVTVDAQTGRVPDNRIPAGVDAKAVAAGGLDAQASLADRAKWYEYFHAHKYARCMQARLADEAAAAEWRQHHWQVNASTQRVLSTTVWGDQDMLCWLVRDDNLLSQMRLAILTFNLANWTKDTFTGNDILAAPHAYMCLASAGQAHWMQAAMTTQIRGAAAASSASSGAIAYRVLPVVPTLMFNNQPGLALEWGPNWKASPCVDRALRPSRTFVQVHQSNRAMAQHLQCDSWLDLTSAAYIVLGHDWMLPQHWNDHVAATDALAVVDPNQRGSEDVDFGTEDAA